MHFKKEYHLELSLTPQDWLDELHKRSITYGIHQEHIEQLCKGLKEEDFPLLIAEGTPAKHGENGRIKYEITANSQSAPELDERDAVDLRNVMQIPTVREGDKLLTIISPTKGEAGKTVFDKPIPAKPGKPVRTRAGKNVKWRESKQAMYATVDGQVSFFERVVHVHPYFEVNHDIDMKTGNLDFVGTIIVRGNVPSGYTLKAQGDIKVYGFVEGATLIADGSIYISEGIAATSKGSIQAGVDVHAGYVNQGNIEAGRHIQIEHSILHSDCVARNSITCHNGNIIGGSLSAGHLIQCKDIGNKMSTKTEMFFGANKKLVEKENSLLQQKEETEDSLEKLDIVGKKLHRKKEKEGALSAQERVTLLRQRNSIAKCKETYQDIQDQLEELQEQLTDNKDAKLMVEGILHPNTTIAFRKYKRHIKKQHHRVYIQLDQSEIVIHPLT